MAQKAIAVGIDRTLDLPEIPDLEDIGSLLQVLNQLRERLIGMYDDLGSQINRIAVEQAWEEMDHDQLTADQDDYDLGIGVVHRFTTDASRTVTGFERPVISIMVVILNVGSNDLVLAHQNASSEAANRILTASGANVTLGSDASAFLWYDGGTSRWRQIK